MNAMKLLKQGIETSNWQNVISAFEMLTGEKLIVQNESPSSLLMDLQSLVNKYSESTFPPSDLTEIDTPTPTPTPVKSSTKSSKKATKTKTPSVEPNVRDIEKLLTLNVKPGIPGEPMRSGPINNVKRRMIDVGQILVDEGLEVKNEEETTNRQSRPKKMPKMFTCTKCGNSFDLNKAYPAGIAAGVVKCTNNACQERHILK